ncbi:MAG TPA: hypothetical protein VK983_04590 [Candidatus Limnocylindrales bacterium]|nr:hypothetical protein [Candidatus Limnocylindrales bacterium]
MDTVWTPGGFHAPSVSVPADGIDHQTDEDYEQKHPDGHVQVPAGADTPQGCRQAAELQSCPENVGVARVASRNHGKDSGQQADYVDQRQ